MPLSDAGRRTSEVMQAYAEVIDETLQQITGEKMGFCLVVFPETDGSLCNYISNCDRKEVKDALEHLIMRWDMGMRDVPAHIIEPEDKS